MTRPATQPMTLPKIIGHRGACGHAPENTMASFEKAKQLGVDWVEFDVQLTADHKLVVFHDFDFYRMTGNHALVAETPYAECSQFDVGCHFAPEFRGQIIPLLDDVLRFCLDRQVMPNIEIKPCHHSAEDTAEVLVKLLADLWPVDHMPPLITSFDHDVLAVLRSMDANVQLGLLWENCPRAWLRSAEAIQACAIVLGHHFITPENSTEIREAGYRLLTYTVNDPARAQKLWQWGVDAVISDYPDRLHG